MYSAEVITPQHRTRKAVISIRQSTPHQALSHQESLRLQYALTERARALGWSAEAIEVMDTDVGYSAASATHREGFNALVGQVTLGQVGIILSSEVTRLSRHCSDWYPLLGWGAPRLAAGTIGVPLMSIPRPLAVPRRPPIGSPHPPGRGVSGGW